MSGYIGAQPVPQATQHREAFTATASQTSFPTVGYTPQFVDVYLNGVKLAAADYTATNGSDIVLATGAAASDILEYVAYTPFEVADQTFTGTTTTDVLTTTGAFTSLGIDDNATSTAVTIDASGNALVGTTDGTSTIGTTDGIQLRANNAIAGVRSNAATLFLSRNGSDGAVVDLRRGTTTVGSIDVSATGASIKLGGTAAANKLDDYEEGTWTPVISDGTDNATSDVSVGSYTKTGNHVHVQGRVRLSSLGSVNGSIRMTGLPFAGAGPSNNFSAMTVGRAVNLNLVAGTTVCGDLRIATTQVLLLVWDASLGNTGLQATEFTADGDISFSMDYLST